MKIFHIAAVFLKLIEDRLILRDPVLGLLLNIKQITLKITASEIKSCKSQEQCSRHRKKTYKHHPCELTCRVHIRVIKIDDHKHGEHEHNGINVGYVFFEHEVKQNEYHDLHRDH